MLDSMLVHFNYNNDNSHKIQITDNRERCLFVSNVSSEIRRKRATEVKGQIICFSIKAALSNSLLVDMFWVKDIIREVKDRRLRGFHKAKKQHSHIHTHHHISTQLRSAHNYHLAYHIELSVRRRDELSSSARKMCGKTNSKC